MYLVDEKLGLKLLYFSLNLVALIVVKTTG